MKFIFAVLVSILPFFFSISSSLSQVNCAPLEPSRPENTTTSFQGKIDGKIDGLFARLAGAGVAGDVVYRETKDALLKDFPNASDLYLRERLIYLKCEAIRNGETSQTLEEFSSQILSLPSEEKVIYKLCRLPDFGQSGWDNVETITMSSGWRSGWNQTAWCSSALNQAISARGIGSTKFEKKVLKKWEDAKWGNRLLRSNRQYNYHCRFQLSWNPIYNEKRDERCGVLE